MTETLRPQTSTSIDPTLSAGSKLSNPELKIRFHTFEEARTAENHLSDEFIEGAIENKLKIGNQEMWIKEYIDHVEATSSDNEVIANPVAIAGLYLKTTDMLSRNLKIISVRNPDPDNDAARKNVIKTARDNFRAKLRDEGNAVAHAIVEWCNRTTRDFPYEAMEYYGMVVDGKDPLSADSPSAPDFRTNFKIQRQVGGAFIMAYSENRVKEKIRKQDQELTRRIYLNPEIFATPDVFEQVLEHANQTGLSIQLKMYQRTPELVDTHVAREHSKSNLGKDGLRGDGIVIYATDSEADTVLDMVLAIAKDKPEAFVGRETSRIPQNVAEGIAVGDEPTQRGTSLASHRAEILNHVTAYVRKSGRTGEAAKALFRRYLAATAKANDVNPGNLAFNLTR